MYHHVSPPLVALPGTVWVSTIIWLLSVRLWVMVALLYHHLSQTNETYADSSSGYLKTLGLGHKGIPILKSGTAS